MKLISSRCSIFYFLLPSMPASVRDAVAVTLFSSKDSYVSIYFYIHVESEHLWFSLRCLSNVLAGSPVSHSLVHLRKDLLEGIFWELLFGQTDPPQLDTGWLSESS